MLAQLAQHVDVDRDAVVLHGGGGGHVAAAQQGPRQIDARQHGRQQARQRLDVAFAIVEDRVRARRPTTGPPRMTSVAHFLLFGRADGVEAEVGQRAQQAGAGGRREPVGPVPEFREQIEDAGRHRPAESAVAAELGAGVVGDEQRVGVDRIWRRRPELVAPEPDRAARSQLLGDQADRLRPLAGLAR